MFLWLYDLLWASISHAGEYQDKYDELTNDRKTDSKSFVVSCSTPSSLATQDIVQWCMLILILRK